MTILLSFLCFIIGLEFLYPFSIRYMGFPQLPTLSVQFLIIGFFIFVYLNSIISNKKLNISYPTLKNYAFLFIAFLMTEILSAFINSNSLLLVMKSMISYSMIYLLLFLAILEMDMDDKGQKNLIKFVYLLILIQIPVTLYQYLFLGYSSADYNSGTVASANLGGTGTTGFLMLFFQAFLVANILIKGFHIKKIIFILLTFIPIVVGGVRMGIILSPITIILTIVGFFLINPHKNLKKVYRGIYTVMFTLIMMLLLILIIIPNTKFSNYLSLDILTNKKAFEKYDSSNLKFSRTYPYYVLFKYTLNSNVNYLLGNGNQEITHSKIANAGEYKIKIRSIISRCSINTRK